MAIKYLLQMITKLKISNFKSHENTELTLGSLTLLTGVNGCGKTSIVQSLLLLRQTYLKGRLDSGLDLNKSLCSIGVANDALYRNAKNGCILFEFISEGEIFSLQFDAGNNLESSFIPKVNYSENVTNDKLAEISKVRLSHSLVLNRFILSLFGSASLEAMSEHLKDPILERYDENNVSSRARNAPFS